MRRSTTALALAAVLSTLLGGCSSAVRTEDGKTIELVDWRFVGDDSYHDFELRRVVEDLLIDFERDPTKESLLVDAASDLRDFYESRGFPEARVRYRIDRTRKPLRVVFETAEGPRVTIENMHLRGNKAFRAVELLPLWSRQRSGILGTGDPYFVRAELDAFRISLRGKYRDSGFLDASVEGPLVERQPGSDVARIAYDIEEGPRFVLESLDIESSILDAWEGRTADENRREIDSERAELVGEAYETLRLDAFRDRLRKRLQDDGYPTPSIRVEMTVERQADTGPPNRVRAKVTGTPGPRRRVHSVAIVGNDRTADRIVRRRISVRSGEWYDASKIDKAVGELYLTGLFSRIEVGRESAPDADGDVITFRLEEAEAREVGILAGYGSYELARTKLFLADNNLFGIGQSLRVTGKISQKSYGADATWREPRLFATDTGLAVTAAITQREEPTFTDISRSLSAAFDRRIFDATQLRVGYSIARSDGSNIDSSLRSLVVDDFVVSTVFTELAFDDRDSRLFPTRGSRALLRLEHADNALGGDITFDRATVQAGINTQLAERWILTAAMQSGVVFSKDAVPVQERFFNGGNSTVRSFRQSQLGPKTPLGRPSGGEFRNVFNLELRFPVFGPFEGAVFGDAGNVGVSVDDFGLDDMRYAIGAGLRFVLPIGPVRFDAGFNPNPHWDEDDYTLHLSVGYPF
ncbi:MAG: BamA/TamA family outer membrane protein [Planctomycetes bacterium]|nr:BamA/TamA family outer membrane protein [Planctomycetota bacterium]